MESTYHSIIDTQGIESAYLVAEYVDSGRYQELLDALYRFDDY